ncbi:MAG: hypothetical protein ACFCVK_14325 [Acidimicrobiales bacterium]
MTSTNAHHRPALTDREYYTQLWGTANLTGRTPSSWSTAKHRAGIVALLASAALAAQLLLGTVGIDNDGVAGDSGPPAKTMSVAHRGP